MSRHERRRPETKRNRDIQRADDGAEEAWREAVLETIHEVAREQPVLTTDDVLAANPELEGAREMRALGPMFLRAARAGWIEPTKRYGPSRRRQSNCRHKRLWRSLVHPDARRAHSRPLDIVEEVLG